MHPLSSSKASRKQLPSSVRESPTSRLSIFPAAVMKSSLNHRSLLLFGALALSMVTFASALPTGAFWGPGPPPIVPDGTLFDAGGKEIAIDNVPLSCTNFYLSVHGKVLHHWARWGSWCTCNNSRHQIVKYTDNQARKVIFNIRSNRVEVDGINYDIPASVERDGCAENRVKAFYLKCDDFAGIVRTSSNQDYLTLQKKYVCL